MNLEGALIHGLGLIVVAEHRVQQHSVVVEHVHLLRVHCKKNGHHEQSGGERALSIAVCGGLRSLARGLGAND